VEIAAWPRHVAIIMGKLFFVPLFLVGAVAITIIVALMASALLGH